MHRFAVLLVALSACSGSSTASFLDSATVSPADARAKGAPAVALQRISAASPFAPGACGSRIDTTINNGRDSHGLELEPTFAIAPQGLVAAWVQDDGLGIVATRSSDGSAWTQGDVAGFTPCDGVSTTFRIFNARLAVDGNGTIFLLGNGKAPGPNSPVIVSTSHDGGATWSGATTLNLPGLSDEPTMSADPSDSGAVSVIWSQRGAEDTAWFARTTDDGASWSRSMIRPTPAGAIGHNRLVTLADGTLVDVTTDNPLLVGAAGAPDATGFGLHIRAYRSVDHGINWNETTIMDLPAAGSSIDAGFPADPAIGPDGAVYLMFPDGSGGTTTWRIFRSVDGSSWSQVATAPLPADAGALLIPGFAIAADGTMAVLYDLARDGGRDTNVWLTYSHNGGRTWSTLHLGGPFDSNVTGGLGEYEELHPLGHGLGAVFALGAPDATQGVTDIFLARIFF